MHIALDARLVYYRRTSGIGQYMVHLIDALPALNPDWQYTIIHSRKDRTTPMPSSARSFSAWTPSHHRFEQIVFPSINFSNKGQRVKTILQDLQLRPENVLFVDDSPFNEFAMSL